MFVVPGKYYPNNLFEQIAISAVCVFFLWYNRKYFAYHFERVKRILLNSNYVRHLLQRTLDASGVKQGEKVIKPSGASTGMAVDAHDRKDMLETYLKFLVNRSWNGKERTGELEFILPEGPKSDDLSSLTTSMLSHLRRVAPNLDIPFLTPRVVFERLVLCSGQFTEHSDGWVSISIDIPYVNYPSAARSILCHELCHYVLGHNGIRYDEFLENEHLTEAAMFAFGLGEIFLAGYRFIANEGKEHQIGYLTSTEYDFLRKSALKDWRTLFFGPDHNEQLESIFRTLFPDSRRRDRLISHEMAKFPGRTRQDNIRNIIESYHRDRR